MHNSRMGLDFVADAVLGETTRKHLKGAFLFKTIQKLRRKNLWR